jgi:hypothetical protein
VFKVEAQVGGLNLNGLNNLSSLYQSANVNPMGNLGQMSAPQQVPRQYQQQPQPPQFALSAYSSSPNPFAETAPISTPIHSQPNVMSPFNPMGLGGAVANNPFGTPANSPIGLVPGGYNNQFQQQQFQQPQFQQQQFQQAPPRLPPMPGQQFQQQQQPQQPPQRPPQMPPLQPQLPPQPQQHQQQQQASPFADLISPSMFAAAAQPSTHSTNSNTSNNNNNNQFPW